jgi:hypothetical protein
MFWGSTEERGHAAVKVQYVNSCNAILSVITIRCSYIQQQKVHNPVIIWEVSHQYENDNDNDHVITLWVYTCDQIMTSSRVISF